jgi:hypothetical protein
MSVLRRFLSSSTFNSSDSFAVMFDLPSVVVLLCFCLLVFSVFVSELYWH